MRKGNARGSGAKPLSGRFGRGHQGWLASGLVKRFGAYDSSQRKAATTQCSSIIIGLEFAKYQIMAKRYELLDLTKPIAKVAQGGGASSTVGNGVSIVD